MTKSETGRACTKRLRSWPRDDTEGTAEEVEAMSKKAKEQQESRMREREGVKDRVAVVCKRTCCDFLSSVSRSVSDWCLEEEVVELSGNESGTWCEVSVCVCVSVTLEHDQRKKAKASMDGPPAKTVQRRSETDPRRELRRTRQRLNACGLEPRLYQKERRCKKEQRGLAPPLEVKDMPRTDHTLTIEDLVREIDANHSWNPEVIIII